MELLAIGLALLGLGLLLWGLWPRRRAGRAGQVGPQKDSSPVLAGAYVAPTFDLLVSPPMANDVLNVTAPTFSDPVPVDAGPDAFPTGADSATDSRLSDAGCLPDPSDSVRTDWGSNDWDGSTDTASCDTGSSSSDSGSSDSGSSSSE